MGGSRRRHHEIRDELEPGIHPRQLRALEEVAERLQAERPIPRPAFRGELRRHLEGLEQPKLRWRPARLRVQVAAYSGSGLLLLAIAGIGLAGLGPFAA